MVAGTDKVCMQPLAAGSTWSETGVAVEIQVGRYDTCYITLKLLFIIDI